MPAGKLVIGDELLTKDMTVKSISYIKCIFKSLKIYLLEVENSHTFFVGKHSVLTHNVALPMALWFGFSTSFGSGAVVAASSFFGPLALTAGVAIGVLQFAVKAIKKRRSLHNEIVISDITMAQNCCSIDNGESLKSAGCFGPEDFNNQTYAHVFPKEDLVYEEVGCIKLEVGLDTSAIRQSCVTDNELQDGSPIRKLLEDIPETEMFKKGHLYALDRFHAGDHMEVWDKQGKWLGVVNLDGTKNIKKSEVEENPGMRKLPK